MVRFYGFVALIVATNVSAATIVQCNAKLKVSVAYNHETNSTEFLESNANLSGISINFDSGFIKLSDSAESESILFRQSALNKNITDPFDLVVRYERKSDADIQTKSVIITDPMCRNDDASTASTFDISNTSYISTFYNCDCLSSVHDSGNFIIMD
jgi:hypothetical protein